MAFKNFILNSLAISFISSLAGASPIDAQTKAIEVIPGPGMRSLKELGLSSADLFDPNFLEKHNLTIPSPPARSDILTRSAQYTASCVSGTNTEGTRANAIACRNLLISQGASYCDIPGDVSYDLLCSAGDTEVVGENYYGVRGGVVADCSDVAIAVSWAVDNCSQCTQDNCLLEGSQTANNNPDYVVYVGLYDGNIKHARV